MFTPKNVNTQLDVRRLIEQQYCAILRRVALCLDSRQPAEAGPLSESQGDAADPRYEQKQAPAVERGNLLSRRDDDRLVEPSYRRVFGCAVSDPWRA